MVCWHHCTSWSIFEENAHSQIYLKSLCGFLITSTKQKRMVSVTAKSPEDGFTAVNDNNNHQSNAEEFREEKGTFHSLLSEKLILSLTSGWAHMSYRLKTSAMRHAQAVVHNLQTKPHQREGTMPHCLPNSCPGGGKIWNLSKVNLLWQTHTTANTTMPPQHGGGPGFGATSLMRSLLHNGIYFMDANSLPRPETHFINDIWLNFTFLNLWTRCSGVQD